VEKGVLELYEAPKKGEYIILESLVIKDKKAGN
jgi:hypothetical protein